MDVSGPFLSLPVLDRAFPQEMDAHDPERSAELRRLYEDWQDERTDANLHRTWVLSVLTKTLELPAGLIVRPEALPGGLEVRIAQHHETLRPELVLVNPPGRTDAGKPRLLIQILSPEQDLEKPLWEAEWKASPATRMTELLRGAGPDGVRLGLVTNGERWMLVHASRGETAGYATWLADLWLAEPVTLRAFRSLLGVRRFFAVPDDETLEALYTASSQDQQDVTDRLGLQVRRAVTILVQAMDRIDKDRKRSLLTGFDERQLYEAAVTTMMRLVFLLYAEEQGLLPIDDPFYGANYAVSTLLEQLQAEEDMSVLERRHAAWNRLLATFRAVHGGIEHEAMRLPPYGGGLFDPDRFPFLEGRARGSRWRDAQAQPLPIDDATVLDLLASLQFLEVRGLSGEGTEAQRLSFKALGVEQIGHVYESLLEHTAVRATAAFVGLDGPEQPEIALDELEARRRNGRKEVVEYLAGATGKTARVAEKALEYEIPKGDAKWLVSCGNDPKLLDRVRPWAGLVRADHAGIPVVIEPGSVYVTKGSDRRSTGTHYTPPSLTEPIVQYTLEPLVYEGPTQGKREEEWVLRPAREILGLKVCDMACGSGAFLVQACRYLSERLAEAWAQAEARAGGRVVVTPEGELSEARPSECIIPKDPAERLTVARRLVADRCLYGVDVNPMAVEMAKLSLWLVTLEKGKPFTFLDHAIKYGDSLLGISDARQVEDFTLDPEGRSRFLLLADASRRALQKAEERRRQLENFTVLDIQDATEKARLLDEAEDAATATKTIGDVLIGLALSEATDRRDRELPTREDAERLVRETFAEKVSTDARRTRLDRLAELAQRFLGNARGRSWRPFHWPLEFPEVFAASKSTETGFSAIIGNPPFITGKRISTVLGEPYNDLLKRSFRGSKGAADISVFFLRRGDTLISSSGFLGIITTKSAAEGASRRVGLEAILASGGEIYRAVHELPWPGTAGVIVSVIHITRRQWTGPRVLNGKAVAHISSRLDGATEHLAHQLAANRGLCSDGIKIQGEGFIIDDAMRALFLAADARNARVIQPYLTGSDIAQSVSSKPRGWIINFGTMTKVEASRYGAPFELLQSRVKPYRDNLTGQIHEQAFWRYWDKREEFFRRMGSAERILACPSTAKFLLFIFIARDCVPSHSVKLFAFSDAEYFCLLQSSVHETWARELSGKLGQTLAYSLSEAFASFPFPSLGSEQRAAGESYVRKRTTVCARRGLGLTDLYNKFHNAAESAGDILELREAHTVVDRAAANAYGWTDIALGHDFFETKQGVRFTIRAEARREILTRLMDLNHKRHAEESQGRLRERPTTARVEEMGERRGDSQAHPLLEGLEDAE
jgi:hypothetical protein